MNTNGTNRTSKPRKVVLINHQQKAEARANKIKDSDKELSLDVEAPLTAKQERFADAVASGELNYSAAYRLAYDAENMAPATVNSAASRLMSDSRISLRIAQIKDDLKDRISHDRALARGWLARQLQHIATDPKVTTANQLRALDQFAKLGIVAGYIDDSSHEDTKPILDSTTIDEQIASLLTKLLPKPQG